MKSSHLLKTMCAAAGPWLRELRQMTPVTLPPMMPHSPRGRQAQIHYGKQMAHPHKRSLLKVTAEEQHDRQIHIIGSINQAGRWDGSRNTLWHPLPQSHNPLCHTLRKNILSKGTVGTVSVFSRHRRVRYYRLLRLIWREL